MHFRPLKPLYCDSTPCKCRWCPKETTNKWQVWKELWNELWEGGKECCPLPFASTPVFLGVVCSSTSVACFLARALQGGLCRWFCQDGAYVSPVVSGCEGSLTRGCCGWLWSHQLHFDSVLAVGV